MYRRLLLVLALLSAFIVPVFAAENTDNAPPKTPTDGVIHLFNGKNLDGWYTFIRGPKGTEMSEANYQDPKGVFKAEDGMVHISGDGWGYMATKDTYRDYHLVCEFKWGTKTWDTRKERCRDTGILVHCFGPDGMQNSWISSIESNVMEGSMGDFVLIGGQKRDPNLAPVKITCEVRDIQERDCWWKAGGERITIGPDNQKRVNWYGRDPNWKDEIGFHGPGDLEKPTGEWNRMDVICDGGHITVYFNGVKVNEGFDCNPTSGKLAFQTECAEVFYRTLDLYPIGKAPPYVDSKQAAK